MTVFDRLCRVPGTRCAAIMDMIDRGLSDEAIAARYMETDEKLETAAQTIAVELKQLLSTVRDILDALDDAEAAALNVEYERSV